jgi:antitoxin (DNA-binding transcriptional repressor) of toxin-antitoxin stability system
MKTITFTEFRKNASELFSNVEQGEVFVVIRHGKPIAEVSPVSRTKNSPAWKQPALRLSSKGSELSSAIIEDRDNENIF